MTEDVNGFRWGSGIVSTLFLFQGYIFDDKELYWGKRVFPFVKNERKCLEYESMFYFYYLAHNHIGDHGCRWLARYLWSG